MISAKNSSLPINACKRIVFFGSSEFSLAALEFLLSLSLDSLTVITTPDRPQGRGLELQPNPVRKKCMEEHLNHFAPETLREAQSEEKIGSLKPDLFVVSSYGKMIPTSWLKIPAAIALNVHPSLLPKYRGAAPIPWQILNGEKETGVSIAEVTKDLDAGDLFSQIRIPLEESETTESLTKKLSELSKTALKDALDKIKSGAIRGVPQNHKEFTYARKLTKEDGLLHWSEPASILARKIRAFHPWPGTFIHYNGKILRIFEAKAAPSAPTSKASPGTLREICPTGELQIQTGEGSLLVSKVQLAGRRLLSAKEFANGERLGPGFVFEDGPQ